MPTFRWYCCRKLTLHRHGQWCWRMALPADSKGTRRPRRRSGFESAAKAQEELDQVRDLLAIAGDDDEDTRRKIGDVIATVVAAKQKLPEVEAVRRLVRAGASVLEHPYMDDVFTAFLALKEKTRSRNTYRSRSWSTTTSSPSTATAVIRRRSRR